jgi:predicted glycoside hydrolase/deacetylase ChbG (UPF0249 family)
MIGWCIIAQVSRLCITVDDYGLDRAGNAAIEDLAERGLVSAVSVMVHADACLETLPRLRATGVRLGLHLCFTRERPLLQCSKLIDREGRLPSSWARLFLQLATRPWLARDLSREARAQRDRYRALALPLSFINGHEHAHLFPSLWRDVAALVEESPGAGVRVASTQRLAWSRQGMVALASRVSFGLRPLAGRRLFSPLGVSESQRLQLNALPALLDEAAHFVEPAIAELVVHPTESQLLASPELPLLFARHGLQLLHREPE